MVLNPNYNEDHDWAVCSAPSSTGNDEDSDNNDNDGSQDDDSEADDDDDEVSEQTNDWTIPTVIANDETAISDFDSKLLLSKTDQEKEHTWNPTATTTTTSTPPPSLRFRRTAAVHTIQKAGQNLGSTIQGIIGKSNSGERPTQQQQPKKEQNIAVIAKEKQSLTAIIVRCLGYVVSVASVIGGGIMFLKGQRHVGALLLATAGGTLWGTEQTWDRRQKKNRGWFP
eukprot:scaffold13879_cov61-Cylindrotheca_fusiformis.AAC.1